MPAPSRRHYDSTSSTAWPSVIGKDGYETGGGRGGGLGEDLSVTLALEYQLHNAFRDLVCSESETVWDARGRTALALVDEYLKKLTGTTPGISIVSGLVGATVTVPNAPNMV